MQTRRLLCALCISALMPILATPAQGELLRAGHLLCSTSPRIGFLVGSTQSLRCVFDRRNSSQRYIYAGRIRRVGLDLGVTGSGVLSWAVFAKNRIGPGTMRGSYVGASGNVALGPGFGASGNVALGPGFGANVLIGGSRRSVVLQPLSTERAIGVNLAATVTHLTLGDRGRR